MVEFTKVTLTNIYNGIVLEKSWMRCFAVFSSCSSLIAWGAKFQRRVPCWANLAAPCSSRSGTASRPLPVLLVIWLPVTYSTILGISKGFHRNFLCRFAQIAMLALHRWCYLEPMIHRIYDITIFIAINRVCCDFLILSR